MDQQLVDLIDEQWREINAEAQEDTRTESAGLDRSTYSEQVSYWQDRAPEGYSEQYTRLLDANCSPRVAAAVCQYVAGYEREIEPRTQKELADEFNISQRTISNWYEYILPSTTRDTH